jgi:hypothetical protein
MGDDFSGMIGYSLKTSITSEEAIKRMSRGVGVLTAVPIDKIPGFIIEHYAIKGDLVGDGCAPLLGNVDPETFKIVVEELRTRGREIKFGTLLEGRFTQW